MDFILRYRGALPSSSKRAVRDKHDIRMALTGQLAELCKREPFFRDALTPQLLTGKIKSGKLTFDHDQANPANNLMFCRVQMGGFEFVPLIHREHYLACQLDITWLRQERAGDIVHGGDLDNRLKKLFDGLRMPQDINELGHARPDAENERVYCLLDDDALITKLSVATYQMLEPHSDERSTDVDLLLHITVLSTKAVVANLGLH